MYRVLSPLSKYIPPAYMAPEDGPLWSPLAWTWMMAFCAIVLIATANIASACRNDVIVDIDEPVFMALQSDSVKKSGLSLSNCFFSALSIVVLTVVSLKQLLLVLFLRECPLSIDLCFQIVFFCNKEQSLAFNNCFQIVSLQWTRRICHEVRTNTNNNDHGFSFTVPYRSLVWILNNILSWGAKCRHVLARIGLKRNPHTMAWKDWIEFRSL